MSLMSLFSISPAAQKTDKKTKQRVQGRQKRWMTRFLILKLLLSEAQNWKLDLDLT